MNSIGLYNPKMTVGYLSPAINPPSSISIKIAFDFAIIWIEDGISNQLKLRIVIDKFPTKTFVSFDEQNEQKFDFTISLI